MTQATCFNCGTTAGTVRVPTIDSTLIGCRDCLRGGLRGRVSA